MTSAAIERVTPAPRIETIAFPTRDGRGEAELYLPASRGPHPGVVAVLGVVPAGVDHPQLRALAQGLVRSGFAAALYRSRAMGDLRVAPEDTADIASLYRTLLAQPYVDARTSGLMGVCVGGSFALMAAADPGIRSRVRYVFAYAPFSSMRTLAIDIASGSRDLGDVREPWDVDPLTWQTYVRSLTEWLSPAESRLIRTAYEQRIRWNAGKTAILHSAPGAIEAGALSDDAAAVRRLLDAGPDDVASALEALPARAKALLTAMSPITYLDGIVAPRIVLLHDRDDHVIPVGESRRLWSALAARPGASYREMGLRHLRMPDGLPVVRLVREIARSYLAWYPLFRESTA